MRKYLGIIIVGAMVAVGAGCGDDDNGGTGGTAGTGGTGGTAGTGGTGQVQDCNDAESDSTVACELLGDIPTEDCADLTPQGIPVDCSAGSAGVDLCADAGGSGTVTLGGEEIDESTCLSADCEYVLQPTGPALYVTSGTLSIEPGVIIRGTGGPGLVITRNATIQAVGTASAPIVFTSGANVGSRTPSDIGGLVLLGRAPLSWGNAACDGTAGECEANIEGLPPTEGRGIYGGDDPAHDCGDVNYLRVEYAGFIFGDDNELNSLTVGGCGTGTNLSHIQLHRGLDDGIEFFGGTADVDHLLVTGTDDDCVDWDQGYRGRIRCVIAHHFNGGEGDDSRGIEADNYSQNNNAAPRSAPILQYATFIGSKIGGAPGVTGDALVLRRGTCGVIQNVSVIGFEGAGLDLRDGAWSVPMGWGDNLRVENTCFWNNGPFKTDLIGEPVGDGVCEEGIYFSEPDDVVPGDGLMNSEADPMLGDVSGAINGSGDPDWALGNTNCKGGLGESGTDWTFGWTDYSVN